MATSVLAVPELQSQSHFDADYLTRLRNGDADTWSHFENYFRRKIERSLNAQFRRQIADELTGEVFSALVEKIQQCALKDAARLPAYVAGVCRNAARSAIRGFQRENDVEVNWDTVAGRSENPEEEILDKEKAQTVQNVLRQLNARDRRVLVQVLCDNLDRGKVCQLHGVTREQLRIILFHARQKFQRQWRRRILPASW